MSEGVADDDDDDVVARMALIKADVDGDGGDEDEPLVVGVGVLVAAVESTCSIAQSCSLVSSIREVLVTTDITSHRALSGVRAAVTVLPPMPASSSIIEGEEVPWVVVWVWGEVVTECVVETSV